MTTLRMGKMRIRFDDKAIAKAISRREQIALNRYGSFARKHARKEIKIARVSGNKYGKAFRDLKSDDASTRKRAAARLANYAKSSGRQSTPGGYPIARTRNQYATIRNIGYAYDRSSRSVVIGPVGLRKATRVPETLEYGRSATLHEVPINRQVTFKGGQKRWLDTRTGKFVAQTPTMQYRPASSRTAKSTPGGRSRRVHIGKRPTMSLTYGAMDRAKTMKKSIEYADRKLGGR